VPSLQPEDAGNRMSSVKWPEGNLICGYLEQYEDVAERRTVP